MLFFAVSPIPRFFLKLLPTYDVYMRQRKRADWPITVYRYWVRLEYDTWTSLPEEVKQEAEAMRALWNRLVAAFGQRLSAARDILNDHSQAEQPNTRVPTDSRTALRQLQHSFQEETRQHIAASTATWANTQFIVTQFQAALTRFFKQQDAPPRVKVSFPHEVHFQHRFTEGGLPVARLFGRGQRLHLEPLTPTAADASLSQRQQKRLARTTGVFQVGTAVLPFQTILHRPLPEAAYVKSAALIGRQVIKSGYLFRKEESHMTPSCWQWSLQLTLELPPVEGHIRQEDRRTAALHVGCRRMEDGQLRIATLTDVSGHEEAVFLPEAVLQGWRHKCALHSQVEQFITETTSRLLLLPCPENLPPAVRNLWVHREALSSPGLWRLLLALKTLAPSGEVFDVVQHWADRSTRLVREARGLEHRYLGHRDWFYRNFALQLCRRYRRLVISADPATLMTVEPSSQDRERIETLAEEATYRQLAAPARLVTFLQQAAAKTGVETTTEHTPRLRAVRECRQAAI